VFEAKVPGDDARVVALNPARGRRAAWSRASLRRPVVSLVW
jgi:hypothetical protein